MCGISGIVNISNSEAPFHTYIERMTDAIKHRGPDDAGFFILTQSNSIVCAGNDDTPLKSWQSDNLYSPKHHIKSIHQNIKLTLGHRRLSVIDVSAAGHQPMCDENENVWLILNGEIYNYIELRAELQLLGCKFITQSDTEVLLKAYQVWGYNCLSKLNGMWSFVLFDKQKNLLFGSRDRTGVKPLYYFRNKNVFCFASEIKALRILPIVETGINENAAFSHLILNEVEKNGQTFFSNISELPPSKYFTFDLKSNEFDTRTYYKLDVNSTFEPFNELKNKQYIDQVKHLCFESVRKRLRSDIPIGFCLSGGIDSSSIVCMTNELKRLNQISGMGDRLVAFTAVNNIAATDETIWAEKVVEKLGIEWIKTECTAADLFQQLPQMVYYQDSPLVSTSTYAQFKVMQAASERNIQVLIDGQGGDELFAGYVPFYTALYLNFLKKGKIPALFNEINHLHNSPYSLKLFAYSSMKLAGEAITPMILKSKWAGFLRPESQYLENDFWNKHAANMPFAKDFSAEPMNKLLESYFSGYFLKNLLRWEDRCSMRYSIESRTPFSDDVHLINFAFSIPSTYKIHNGWNKSLLRSAMNGVIPNEIRLRTDKLGFSTPQSIWLSSIQSSMKSMVTDLPDSTNFVNKQLLLKNWESIFLSQNEKNKSFAFKYLNYLLWQQAFVF
jgi:asparagine synthase (glutamine-hydrolysing)